jgi:hypothetical protein
LAGAPSPDQYGRSYNAGSVHRAYTSIHQLWWYLTPDVDGRRRYLAQYLEAHD